MILLTCSCLCTRKLFLIHLRSRRFQPIGDSGIKVASNQVLIRSDSHYQITGLAKYEPQVDQKRYSCSKIVYFSSSTHFWSIWDTWFFGQKSLNMKSCWNLLLIHFFIWLGPTFDPLFIFLKPIFDPVRTGKCLILKSIENIISK